jgi:tetratricopeptide (TPR) repeat protein
MLVFALLAICMVAPAALAQSTRAEELYVAAVTSFKTDVNRLEAQFQVQRTVDNARSADLQRQLNLALASLAALRIQAQANNAAATTALTAFAQGGAANVQRGVDALVAAADAEPKSTVEQIRKAANDYKNAARLAFSTNVPKAMDAYKMALRLAPDDIDTRLELAATYLGMARAEKGANQKRALDQAYMYFAESLAGLGSEQSEESREKSALRDHALYGQGYVLVCVGLTQAGRALIDQMKHKDETRAYYYERGLMICPKP